MSAVQRPIGYPDGWRRDSAWRGALLVLVALVATPPPPVDADTVPTPAAAAATPPSTLEDLMRVMATTPGVVAEFTETKHLALLEAPLQTRGTLYFIPPDRMARYTSYPGVSALIIDGDRLIFDDESGGDRIDLGANAVARIFVENFIVLFNGDLEALRSRYSPEFTVAGDSWSLALVPRGDPLAKMIASITLQGDGSGMRSMILREPGGDFSETRFDALDDRREFSAAEIDRLFRRPQPTPP